MAGIRHDVLVLALKNNPWLLAELLRRMKGARLQGPIEPADSALRFAGSLETHPDLVFMKKAPASSWLIVEVQNRKDARKARSWHLATSALLQRHGMGDLVVITASRAVARWAATVAQHRGELGTEKGLKPVVLYLSKKEMAALLNPSAPHLALFAVWARCRDGGEEARQVLARAITLTKGLPEALQEAQFRAIITMVGGHLRAFIEEISMDMSRLPFSKKDEELLARLMNHGKRDQLEGRRSSLLTVLEARGLTPSPAEQKKIAATDDADLIKECIRRAVTATTVAEALAPLRKRRSPRNGAANGSKKASAQPR